MSAIDNIFGQKPSGLVVLDYLQRAYSKDGVQWPESMNFKPELAVSILDVYHDLVANKGFSLPSDITNIRALTAQIRKTLGLGKAEGMPGLAPTAVIKALKDYVNTSEMEIYNWVYPNVIKQPLPTPNPIVETTSNVKWILLAGLAGYILIKTGLLNGAKNE